MLFFSVPRAFYYIFVYTLGIALYDVAKNYYTQGRPYFETDKITPLGECTADFGNPSGHSVMCTQWATLLWLDYFWERGMKSFKCFFALLCAMVFVGSVMFARVYVGVHGINQVVFGCCFGLSLTLYSHFLLREPLMDHIEYILSTHHKLSPKYLVQASLISFVAIALNTFIFTTDLNHFVIPDHWKTNVAKSCPTLVFDGELYFKSYAESMRTQITIAAYFGIYFLMRGTKAQADKDYFPDAQDWRQVLKTVFSVGTLAKVGILLLGAVIPGLFMFLIPKTPYAVSNIFGALLPSLLLGFILFGVCPRILFRLGFNKDQLAKTYKAVPDRVASERLLLYKTEEAE